MPLPTLKEVLKKLKEIKGMEQTQSTTNTIRNAGKKANNGYNK